MSDLQRSKLKFRKGMAAAGLPEEGDEDMVPAAPAASAPSQKGFTKAFTPEEKKMQAAKLAEILRSRK